MIRLRPSGVDEILIKRVQDWYEPGPGVFITSTSTLFSPAMLFTGSTVGVWYDPSDTTTLFQDAAGTTPVTAVEQPVGLVLDKSGRGNHAFQSTAGNRPTLSARYNLLTKSEDFSDAVWNAQTVETTVSANTSETTDPLGGNTADKIIATTANSFHQRGSSALSTTAGVPVTLSISAKAGGYNYIQIGLAASNTYAEYATVVVNLSNGANAGTGGQVGGWTVGNPTITYQDNGWYRIQATITPDSTVSTAFVLINVSNSSTIAPFVGNGTSGIYIWGADLRVANDALGQPAYQRVNTSTDYDTVGFKPYLRFNGTSSSMATNSIDFSYGDKMFVSAGVRKLSDAASGHLVELSATIDSNNGSFVLAAPSTPNHYVWGSKGTIAKFSIVSSGYSAPITNVISGIGNISGDQAILRANGTQVASASPGQGTGNYGNYPLYLGARAGTTLWFNGRLYGMVVAGKQASAAEITSTETYINQKTGAF